MQQAVTTRLLAISATLVALSLVTPASGRAQHHQHEAPSQTVADSSRIPASIRTEHAEIHAELTAATKAPGSVGAAARELAAVLHPHFVREEEIALPPLALLAPLARGDWSPAMRDVLPLTDSLRAEMPRMLQEHEAIRAATMRLRDVARAAGATAVAHLAEKLAVHAQSEEEILYPAAILVGELVRVRANGRGSKP